jgi:homogentisate 1,2-dioxygenase
VNDDWNFAAPVVEGRAASQAHAGLPENTWEREIGRSGFYGPVTHMYHRNPPTAWLSISGPARPRAFVTTAIPDADSPWNATRLLRNQHVEMRYLRLSQPMDHLVRNSDGDDLLFFHSGGGDLYCDYGHLPVGCGDYVLIPRGTMWRLDPEPGTQILIIESRGGGYRIPDRGLLGQHAHFDRGVLVRPALDEAFTDQARGGPWDVRVKRRGQITTVTYPFNPLDAVGWKGDLFPVKLSIYDIRPVSSHRVHIPPSAQTTFLGSRFVVCSLTPRPVESDADAMKLPFFHNNDDYEEVIFFHRGVMRSRSSAGEGSWTLHPSGITHGPHPETLPRMFEAPGQMIDSYSVMVDTADPLEVGELPEGSEDERYADSWLGSIDLAPDASTAAR